MSNRFAAFEEEAKPKGRKTQPVKTEVDRPARVNKPQGRGNGQGNRVNRERRTGHEEGRQSKHLYDRKTAGGNPRAKKGGAGNRNWGNNTEEVAAQGTDSAEVLNNVVAEGEEKVVVEEVEEEDLGPPTKSMEEFLAERQAALVASDRPARGKRNAGFAGKKVVAVSNIAVVQEKKAVAVAAKSNTVSLEAFNPALAKRSPFEQQERRPRQEGGRGGRGDGRGRGRGRGRGGRGEGRGRGGRGGNRNNNRNSKLDLKNDRAFPALG